MRLTNLISQPYKTVKALITSNVVIECDRISYRFENVPFKKLLNWILVEASIYVKPVNPWGWPTHLQIEPTTVCNLRCALCPVTEGMNRPAGYMDFRVFKKLIDEIGDYVFLILLWDWGEPFLNPSIYEMIAYAKQKGIKVVSSTNGHIFAQAENADRLIKSGLDTLIVAVDGISQETYEVYRKKGNLETVVEGIKTIASRKRIFNSKTPLLNLRFIAMRHNEHEIPRLKEWAASIGVDVVTLKTLNPCSNDTYNEKATVNEEPGEKFIPKDQKHRRFIYTKNGPVRAHKNPCKNLWNAPTVHYSGVVCPCTYDYNERFMLGDLGKDTFKNIWFGVSYQRMRKQFRSDWEKIGFCSNCSFAYKGGSCIDETIIDATFFSK